MAASPAPILRIARPTDNLDRLLPFYRDRLGLDVLSTGKITPKCHGPRLRATQVIAV